MTDPTTNPNTLNTRTDLAKAGSHNPGFQNIDLSDTSFFTSDGNDSLWPTDKTRIPDADFLERLSQAYNARPDLVSQWSKAWPFFSALFYLANHTPKTDLNIGGQPINFEGEPPKGYALFRKGDLFVHGHPKGSPFRSIKGFVDHVHAILTDTVATCGCIVCRAKV